MQLVGAVTACQLLIGNASVIGAAAVVSGTVDGAVGAAVDSATEPATDSATVATEVCSVAEESDELSEQPAMANPSIAMTIATARLTSTSRRRSKLS